MSDTISEIRKTWQYVIPKNELLAAAGAKLARLDSELHAALTQEGQARAAAEATIATAEKAALIYEDKYDLLHRPRKIDFKETRKERRRKNLPEMGDSDLQAIERERHAAQQTINRGGHSHYLKAERDNLQGYLTALDYRDDDPVTLAFDDLDFFGLLG